MPYGFLDIAATPSVRAQQTAMGSDEIWQRGVAERKGDKFTSKEAAFIAERDTFFMASVSESGWPYVQHRGGPVGFLKLVSEVTLAFADYSGNRQYISVGNLTTDDRVAIILVDQASPSRMKLFARAQMLSVDHDPALTELVRFPGYRAKMERIIKLHLVAYDWNCPQHIKRRFTEAAVRQATQPLRDRLQELEAENAALRAMQNQ